MPLFGKPRYSTIKVKRVQVPDGRWMKCGACNQIIDVKQIEETLNTCPKCKFHFKMSARERIRLLLDEGSFVEMDEDLTPQDPIEFVDTKPYRERQLSATKGSGLNEAIITGLGTMDGVRLAFGSMDFGYLGGSMGSVVGEKITRLIERAIVERIPVVITCTSGGARMQEAALSLMQMAKTSAAVARLHDAGLLYITLLVNPAMAGVMASFASLGDIVIAEPGALIGFTGPRVIEQTIKQQLPEGFQRSEFQVDHGMVDMVVARKDLRVTLAKILHFFTEGAHTGSHEGAHVSNGGTVQRQ
ncbi:MAG: acetyl-CoA carboxylase carboxyltransferase subunit beta [Verrucomicrobia bacterium]|nr:acetyl-CoA carboxylase carboxyltransferase subunit beta [Verrucomicrobiota bacterium]